MFNGCFDYHVNHSRKYFEKINFCKLLRFELDIHFTDKLWKNKRLVILIHFNPISFLLISNIIVMRKILDKASQCHKHLISFANLLFRERL